MNILKRIWNAFFLEPQAPMQDHAEQFRATRKKHANPRLAMAVYRAERHGNIGYEPMKQHRTRKWKTGGRHESERTALA